MEQQILENHKFQFISLNPVFHKNESWSSISVNKDSHMKHVTRGAAVITLDGKHKFKLHRGAVIFIPRQVIYNMRVNPDFEMLNIHYQIWLKDGEYLDDRLRLPYVFYPDYFEDCEHKLRKMISLPAGNMLQKSLLAYDIVVNHLSSCNLIETHRHVIANKIDQVAEHLRSDDCIVYNIEEILRIACLSKSQFIRKFKQAFGLSPHKYWEQRLLLKICLQIEQTKKTLTEIAEDFGFSSPYYFSRWFKKNAGYSASSFRKGLSY